jgi:hypothetical protein
LGYHLDQIVIASKGDSDVDRVQFKYNVVSVFSLNQYKAFFLTEKSYGVLNVRSKSVVF